MKEKRTQCKPEHYREDYDDLFRFVSYFHQIKSIKNLGASEVLEIGVGNRTVSNYLRENGIEITTLDYDRRLNPRIAGDIRRLPLRAGAFDAVLCCEVLEHLPFEDLTSGLEEICRVTRKNAVLSFPYSCLRLSLSVRIQNLLSGFILRLPLFFLKMPAGGEHYWEMGRSIKYSKRKVRKAIRQSGFKIIKEESPLLNPKHYFFVLERESDINANH